MEQSVIVLWPDTLTAIAAIGVLSGIALCGVSLFTITDTPPVARSGFVEYELYSE